MQPRIRVSMLVGSIAVLATLGFAVPFDAQGSTEGTGQPTTAERALLSFSVFTDAEKPSIYEDTRTWLQDGVWPDPVRVADGEGQRIVYAFTIPPDVDGTYCSILVGNQFVISVAPDQDGRPGEFREEINTISLLGHKVYEGENYRDWVFDLTPYLRESTARKVYVALHDADPSDGYGAAIARVKLAALDEAGRRTLAREQRVQNEFVQEQRRTIFYVMANGGKEEARYLYKEGGPQKIGLYRVLEGASSVIYHLPATEGDASLFWFVKAAKDFLISLAPERNGRPGEFIPVERGRDVFDADELENGWRWLYYIPVDQRLIADGGCYVKIEDANPEQAPVAVAIAVGMRRLQE